MEMEKIGEELLQKIMEIENIKDKLSSKLKKSLLSVEINI